MVGSYDTGEDFDVFFITDPADEIPASGADFPFQYRITILGYPREVDLEVEDGMGTFSILISHAPIILKLSPEGEGIHPPKLGP